MGKVVKKVAPIAIGIGLGYATAGTSTAAWGSYGGLGSIGAAGVGGGLSMGTVLSAGGLAMQGYSAIQSQKYQRKQAGFQRQQVEEQNKAEAARNRYNQLLQKRSRLQTLRQARIQQGQITGSMGGTLGAGGTSSYVGSVGSIGTQASTNLGNINVAEDVGNQITALNARAANFGSQANTAGSRATGWQSMSTLGGNLFAQKDEIANIFKG